MREFLRKVSENQASAEQRTRHSDPRVLPQYNRHSLLPQEEGIHQADEAKPIAIVRLIGDQAHQQHSPAYFLDGLITIFIIDHSRCLRKGLNSSGTNSQPLRTKLAPRLRVRAKSEAVLLLMSL